MNLSYFVKVTLILLFYQALAYPPGSILLIICHQNTHYPWRSTRFLLAAV